MSLQSLIRQVISKNFEFVKIVMALEKKAFLKNFVELFFVEQGLYTILSNMKPQKLEL